jgi:tRNA pseudouridine32 synthase
MIIGLSSPLAHTLSREFVQGEVKKEYIARCSGEFPAEEVVVEQPLLTVYRQMGLNIVHPDGKVRAYKLPVGNVLTDLCLAKFAKTVFKLLHYDRSTNTSVLLCA